jgi:hypothetical protein
MPACDCTLNLRPTKSKVLYCQIVGRSTRTVPGLIDSLASTSERLAAIAGSQKPRAYILDPLWLSADHDLCTPSFLIAPDEDFANEMNKVAGKSYSLRAVSRRVQFEREEAIRRRFEATARFREGRINSKYFAAQIVDHALVNYEPVYKWECQSPTNFSKLLLEKAGIDPESVQGEGEARAVLQAIGRRRYKKLAEIRDLVAAAEAGVTDLWNLTTQEAKYYGQASIR